MSARTQALEADYLRRHCPLAWNTPERSDDYARLGFDLMGEVCRLLRESLGADGVIRPRDLPVRLRMRISVAASQEAPVLRVAKQQDTAIERLGARAPCRSPDDKPPLTADYVEAHLPSAWDDERMRAPYATLGYAVARQVIEGLIDKPSGDPETTRDVPFTVDTTHRAGGCLIGCTGRHCIHQDRR